MREVMRFFRQNATCRQQLEASFNAALFTDGPPLTRMKLIEGRDLLMRTVDFKEKLRVAIDEFLNPGKSALHQAHGGAQQYTPLGDVAPLGRMSNSEVMHFTLTSNRMSLAVAQKDRIHIQAKGQGNSDVAESELAVNWTVSAFDTPEPPIAVNLLGEVTALRPGRAQIVVSLQDRAEVPVQGIEVIVTDPNAVQTQTPPVQPAVTPPPPPPPPAVVDWHVLVNGVSQGPYTEAQLREQIAQGTLTRDALIWNASMAAWAAVSQTPLAATPPPPPPPPPASPAPGA
jgi:hypothetical protein